MKRLAAATLVVLVLATGALAKREFVAQADDFQCLTNGVHAPDKLFYVFHKSRRLRMKALRKATTGKLGKGFPKGTILQVFPIEAMVKRGGRFNREGGGWEYFRLSITADGKTEIVARGGPEVANPAGSCQGCHTRVAPDHDSVCEFVIGAAGLHLTDEQVRAFQATDQRCR